MSRPSTALRFPHYSPRHRGLEIVDFGSPGIAEGITIEGQRVDLGDDRLPKARLGIVAASGAALDSYWRDR